MTLAFQVLGNFLAWKVDNGLQVKIGNGLQVRVGADAIMDCDRRVFIFEELIQYFFSIGKDTLNLMAMLACTTIWSQGCC